MSRPKYCRVVVCSPDKKYFKPRGDTNWEFRIRTGIIVGARNSDFGEKQNDYRIELRVGYYF